jgi:hypothetical protein
MKYRTPNAVRWMAVACGIVTTGCLQSATTARAARSTLVIGIDVSGSFRPHYDDAIRFASHYLYGHLNGLGELRVPSTVLVGSVGGGQPGEAKSFQPEHMFQGKPVAEIEQTLRNLFPPEDTYTDFNAFFDRVATHIKRRGLVLVPINIMLFSDGVPDVTNTPGQQAGDRYSEIDLSSLEYLSRSVTVRLLYATPTVSVEWERGVKRQRVRMWTVDAPVMSGWTEQLANDVEPAEQTALWRWVEDNVNFRVRTRIL